MCCCPAYSVQRSFCYHPSRLDCRCAVCAVQVDNASLAQYNQELRYKPGDALNITLLLYDAYNQVCIRGSDLGSDLAGRLAGQGMECYVSMPYWDVV